MKVCESQVFIYVPEADRKKSKKTKREGNLPNLDGFYKKGSFLEHSTENRLFFFTYASQKGKSLPPSRTF